MNTLKDHVKDWATERAEDYDDGMKGVFKDLLYGGCQSGYVSHLVYYSDTAEFYRGHKAEIDRLLAEMIDSTGLPVHELFGDKWEADDPLANDTYNQNLLAWFGFEETAHQLACELGIEV